MENVREGFLGIFLEEWRMFVDGATDGIVVAGEKRDGNFDVPVKAGELRIFADCDRPLTGLLYKQVDDSWIVVPVSEFSVPATEQEILIGTRVYQLWNSFTAPSAFVERSWVVDNIPMSEMTDLNAALLHVMVGDPISEDLVNCTGLPITSLEDPRLEYERKSVVPAIDAEQCRAKHGILYASPEFWRERICQRRDQAMQDRMAAKTIDDKKAVVLRLEDNSPEAFANAYAECELLTPFRPTSKSYNLKFRMTVPDDWKNCKNVAVVVRNADTGELIGEGKLDASSGIGIVAIKKTDVVVNRASQMVLVMAKGSSNEDI